MRQQISIFLVILYSAILLRPVLPIINYYVQLEAYKAQCVNVRKQVLECEGTCHLQSQIRQNSADSEPIVPITKSVTEDPPFCYMVVALSIKSIPVHITLHAFLSPVLHACRGFSGAVFHPPSENA